MVGKLITAISWSRWIDEVLVPIFPFETIIQSCRILYGFPISNYANVWDEEQGHIAPAPNVMAMVVMMAVAR